LSEEVVELLQKWFQRDAGSLKLENEGTGVPLKDLIEGCEDCVFKVMCIQEVRIRA
jgi:hypothetical protein